MKKKEVTTVFVYGTLRQGQKHHDVIARKIVSIESAWIDARLYITRDHYPAINVSQDIILQEGSRDLHRDAEAEKYWGGENLSTRLEGISIVPVLAGELVSLSSPIHTLWYLDRFEGFDPLGESLYLRSLVPVVCAKESMQASSLCPSEVPPGDTDWSLKPAWVYRIPQHHIAYARRVLH
ncbi:MAG: gamma-glutamylcyclotransferase [Sphaerochaetaceae bacterium]|nr:gamma-glutamylcyclotransferase [Sphaerochaetaceae bacterium]